MNLKKLLFVTVVSMVMLMTLVSCASRNMPKATLVKEDARMFWSINGTDKNGSPSTVYVMGTFHIADAQVYPLAPIVINAINNADRIFGELSAEDNAKLAETLPEVYAGSAEKANGRLLSDSLSAEDVAFLKQMTGEDIFNTCNIYEPWLYSNVISTMLIQTVGYGAEYGIDTNLNVYVASLGKHVEGLDTLEDQLAVMAYGTYDEQLYLLKTAIVQLRDLQNTFNMIQSLYKAYLDDNPDEIDRISNIEIMPAETPEEEEFEERYEKAMCLDRNEKWAATIEDLLYEGGTTFIYAGSAHFCGEKSVFKCMEKNGTLIIE